MRVIFRAVAILGAVSALTGCETGTTASGIAGAPDGTTSPPSLFGSTRKVAQSDVESPDVFSLTGQGLWDGRPSLGGVWVAHSSVTDPERVIIRNTQNGKSIIGALFRRERENPGPSLQVSSDAANALGMLAGQPTEMSVIALRRQEVPAATPVAAVAATEVAAQSPAEAAGAGAAATAPPSNPKRSASAGSAAVASGTTASKAAPVRKGLFGFLKKKPKPDPLEAQPESPSTTTPTAGIEQKPLDPLVATATAGIEQAEAVDSTINAPVVSAPAVKANPELRRPYIQIGTFSSEQNANFAVDQMKAEGLAATVHAGEKLGAPYWRVVVGPATTVSERDAMIALLKKVGYRDAFAVKQ